MPSTLTQTPPPRRQEAVAPSPERPPQGYFERSGPPTVILAAFFVLTLPLAVMVIRGRGDSLLAWLYLWAFGATHFVLTLSIYCTRANLRYFAGSPKTIAIFFAIPASLVLGTAVMAALDVETEWPLLALAIAGLVQAFNFFHLTRQTFGVLQLFKARTKAKFPAWAKRTENAHAYSGVALMMLTFLSGGLCPLLIPGGPLTVSAVEIPLLPVRFALAFLQPLWLATAIVTLALFATTLAATRPATGRRGQASLIAYASFQAFGVMLTSLYLPLYLAALAIHYVEYHVLMLPRCRHSPLDPTSRLDRGFGWVRSRPVLFYAVLLVAGAFVSAGMSMVGRSDVERPAPWNYLALVTLFNGLTVAHYFIEMYIWRFSDPYFRRAMSGLYFTPAAKPHA